MRTFDRARLIRSRAVAAGLGAAFAFTVQSSSAQPDGAHVVPFQDQHADRIDSIMNEWFDPDGPGGVALVVQNGQAVFCKAYGLADLEHDVPMTPASVFNIASVDKQFTAFALALLVAEGSISLDDDIHRYLPELPDYGTAITIRQLVNHTSGLPDEFSLLQMAGYWTDDVITDDQVFKLLQAQTHLLFHPGEKWQYSNSNYSLIARIIERVAGCRLSEFCQQRIFGPLNMTKTRFIDDHTLLVRDRASCYEYSDSGYRCIPVNYCPALYTMAGDLVKWFDNFENPRVGSPEVIHLITEREFLANGEPVDYAFGQFVKEYHGFTSFQHSGHIGAYTCFLVRFPELHLAIACLSNAGYFGATSAGLSIADLFIPLDKGTDAADMISADDVLPTLDSTGSNVATVFNQEEAPTYDGLYQLETTMKILRVRYDPPALSLIHLSDVPLPLIPDVDGKFKMEGVSSKVLFIKDDSGKVTGLHLLLGGQAMAATKIKPVLLSQDQMTRLTGDYYARELMTVCQFRLTDSGLVVQHLRHPHAYLTATDSLNFVGEQKWLRQLRFEMNPAGDVAGFQGSSGYARDIWFQKIE